MTEKLQQGDNFALATIVTILNLFASEKTFQVEHTQAGKQRITSSPVITLHSGDKHPDDMKKIN